MHIKTLVSAFGLSVLSMATFAAEKNIDVKSTMIQRCVSEAVASKMTDQSSAEKVCGCTINVQANNLKLGEFWSIQSAAMSGQDPRNIPSFKRIQPMLDKCRQGVKISPPTEGSGSSSGAKQ